MRDYVETELNGHVRRAHQGQCWPAVQVEGNTLTTNAPAGAKLAIPIAPIRARS